MSLQTAGPALLRRVVEAVHLAVSQAKKDEARLQAKAGAQSGSAEAQGAQGAEGEGVVARAGAGEGADDFFVDGAEAKAGADDRLSDEPSSPHTPDTPTPTPPTPTTPTVPRSPNSRRRSRSGSGGDRTGVAVDGYDIDIDSVITKELLAPVRSIISSLTAILLEHDQHSGGDRYPNPRPHPHPNRNPTRTPPTQRRGQLAT